MTTALAPNALMADTLNNFQAFMKLMAQAFPHIADAAGLDREPHQFTPDEMTGNMYSPNQTGLEALQKDNQEIRDKLDALINRFGVTTSPGTDVV